jgi:C1A family cysteine protease
MTRHLVEVLLLMVLVSCSMAVPSSGQDITGPLDFLAPFLAGAVGTNDITPGEEALPMQAPVSSAFNEHQTSEIHEVGITDEGYALGYIPSPVMLPPLTSVGAAEAVYPAQYDLRSLGRVSPVRNQGSCGSCWAHGAFGSLESALLPQTTWDFSENNLKNYHGFDPACCDGGNNEMSVAYLARWSGPVTESQDPYSASSCTSQGGASPALHLQEAIAVSPKTSVLDNDRIKAALMTYGGLSVSYYTSNTYYNPGTASYYCPQTTGSNHMVTLVGWDDNYDRNRFKTVPPGNGAWICKNSWGTGWGSGGFFYVSYYDKTMGYGEIAGFTRAEPVSNFQKAYSYDPLGWVSSYGYGRDTAWGANVFTAESAENLAAVAFYTPSAGSSYQVDVYTGVGSSPVSGTLRSRTTGSTPYAGYHTIAITPVSLAKDQKFSVVLRVTSPGTIYPIAFELPMTGYSGRATASAGQSFMSSGGSSWTDLTSWRANSNICIKAFTSAASQTPVPTVTQTLPPSPTPTPTPVIPPVDAKFSCSPVYGVAPLDVKFTDLSTGNPTQWSWSFGDGGTSTQQNPTHTYTTAGSYTVGLMVSNGIVSDQVTASV